MAEAVGLAASVFGVATFAASVVTTFQTFVSSYSRAESKVLLLSNDLAVISTTLQRLGEAIKKNEDKIDVEAYNLFARAKSNCQFVFERLEKALKKARREKGISMSALEKLKYACGEEDDLKDLMASIEPSKSTLILVLGYVRISNLQKQRDLGHLDEEQREELMLTLQEVYREVRRRENPKIGPKSNQVDPDTATTPVMSTDPNTEFAEDTTAETLDCVQDQRSHVDNRSSLSEWEQDAHPSLRREPAHPNQTIENHCTSIQPSTSPAKHDANSNSARQPEESCTRPKHNTIVLDQQLDGEENLRRNASCATTHGPSLYEGWLLSYAPSYMDGKTVMFCGLKFYIQYKPPQPAYTTIPFSLDQVWLEDCVLDRSSTNSHIPRQGRQDIMHIIASLPLNAYVEFCRLLEARNQAATSPYHWTVGAMVLVPDDNLNRWIKLPYSKRIKMTESIDDFGRWLIVLRGGAPCPSLDDLPIRNGDPWRRADIETLSGPRGERYLLKSKLSYSPFTSSQEDLELEGIRVEPECCRPALHTLNQYRTDSLPHVREDYELERPRRELKAQKMKKQKEKEEDEENYLYTEEEAKKMMADFLKIFADKKVKTGAAAGKVAGKGEGSV